MESSEDEEPQQQQQAEVAAARRPWPAWQHQQQYRQRQSQQQQQHRRLVPFAVAPILSSASYEKSREIGYPMIPERRINRLPIVSAARAAPTQIYNSPLLHKPETTAGSDETSSRRQHQQQINHEMSQEELNRKRLQRLEARWRKIGPLIGSSSRSPYARMRLINRLHPVAWTHVPTTEAPTTPAITTPQQVFTRRSTTPPPTESTTEIPWIPETVEPFTIPPSRPILPEIVKATTEPPMIRRQHKQQQLHIESSPVIPSRFKAFGQRSRFSGPILEENTYNNHNFHEQEQPSIPPSRIIERTKSFERFEPQEESSGSAITVQDTSDYHSRQTGVGAAPVKRFKFTNKLSYRPRLKIRKPEEQFAARGDNNAQSFPLSLPELAPIGNNNNNNNHHHRQVLPISNSDGPPHHHFEPTNAFMARHRASPDQVDIHQAHGLRPLPVPGLGEQNIQVEPPQQPPRALKKPPTITDWGNTEDFSQPVTEGDGSDSGSSGLLGSGGGGDSAAAFGGDLGMPPPGFFGITGDMQTEPPPTTPAPTTPIPTTRPPPPPEEPFVIPSDSGLRPVAPPKEFTGGFGSAKGSALSSFGGGGGSGSSGGGGNGGGGYGGGSGTGFAPPPPPAPRRPNPSAGGQEYKEEDYFTGDSALMPNRRGPEGDGYGPPVFPGAAPPPPVPSVGLGGGAAGLPPVPPPYRMVNQNENEATTVKPSALLSMLNKADEGFNQAITHLQQGTPPEAAFIDILEVALGSQKLESQAKVLGHVDRTIGLDNLQRLQRWANTGGAFDMVKEQLVKVLRNYKPPESVKAVTIPPQFEYLFSPTG
uniref:Uncharacterized protein n=1 Tax=Panagrolaimus sp. ES5 TaxID=591445 RepID=A0AC34FMH1_9BILA